MKKYNILYVNNFSNFNSGSPKSVLGIAENINKEKFKTIIVVSKKGPLFDEAIKLSIQTVVLPTSDFSISGFFEFLFNLLLNVLFLIKEKIDIIHLNYLGWRDSIVIAAKLLNKKVILHVRNIPNPKTISKSWNVYLSDKIITVSEGTRESFQNLTYAWDKSLVIYNGINIELFSNGKSIKSEFYIDECNLVVGIIGQISQRKGIKYFLEMASIIHKQFNNVSFLIVGEEPKNEKGYLKKMIEYSKELNIENVVIFTGYREDVENIMNSIDILAIPSLSEPFARVILEAMAAGVPVVGTKVDGIPEAVINEKTGFLVNTKDSNELAEAISKLLKNSSMRSEMGKSAHKIASQKYNMKVLSKNVEKVYSQIL